MQDRVSQYPGRVKLTPVSGQENVYDMEWADNPSVVGTPLNKNSLLKDATAALFGLGADALPDGVFSEIKSLFDEAFSMPDYLPVVGHYYGDGSSYQKINLGFTPRRLIVYGKYSADETEPQMLDIAQRNSIHDLLYWSIEGDGTKRVRTSSGSSHASGVTLKSYGFEVGGVISGKYDKMNVDGDLYLYRAWK